MEPGFLERCERAHRLANLDFPSIFDEFFTSHYVFKSPRYFMMARADPSRDAWLVWWADFPGATEFEALRTFLALAPFDRPEVCWCRGLRPNAKLKYYSTARLKRIIRGPRPRK